MLFFCNNERKRSTIYFDWFFVCSLACLFAVKSFFRLAMRKLLPEDIKKNSHNIAGPMQKAKVQKKMRSNDDFISKFTKQLVSLFVLTIIFFDVVRFLSLFLRARKKLFFSRGEFQCKICRLKYIIDYTDSNHAFSRYKI